MGRPIVMSTDRSMASDYRGTAYFGFSACLPRRLLPEPLYYRLAAPPAPVDRDGALGLADCGARKVEAALRRAGHGGADLVFAHPDQLERAVGPETKVFLFGSHDPLGRGPLTAMLTGLMGRGRQAYNAAAVRRMLADPALRRHRPTVIAGGAGAWELAADPDARRSLGVDCVVVGEAERVVPELVRAALSGEDLPEVAHGPTVPSTEIPQIAAPTVNGVVEVTRGCGRGCRFCVPNLQSLRSLPLEQVVSEASLTAPANRGRVVLHAEDIFRYRALPRFAVNHDAVCELFAAVAAAPGVASVGASHGTITGALSSPQTLRELSRILRVGRPGGPPAIGFQAGIETGSRRLAGRWLAAKMRPYEPADWPEIVREGAEIMHRSGFFSAFTLVFGFPGETEQDIRDTQQLVKQLRTLPSLLVPLFYTPMGVAHHGGCSTGERPFAAGDMTPAHFALLQDCWEHNYSHLGRVWELYGHEERPRLKRAVRTMIGPARWYLRHRLRRFVDRQRGPAPGSAQEGLATPASPRSRSQTYPATAATKQGTAISCEKLSHPPK